MTSPSKIRRGESPGDRMIDRSALALVAAFGLLIFQERLGLNVYTHPGSGHAAPGVSLVALLVLWFRAAGAIVRGWADPSARVLRLSSAGALLLTVFVALAPLANNLMPPYDPALD